MGPFKVLVPRYQSHSSQNKTADHLTKLKVDCTLKLRKFKNTCLCHVCDVLRLVTWKNVNEVKWRRMSGDSVLRLLKFQRNYNEFPYGRSTQTSYWYYENVEWNAHWNNNLSYLVTCQCWWYVVTSYWLEVQAFIFHRDIKYDIVLYCHIFYPDADYGTLCE